MADRTTAASQITADGGPPQTRWKWFPVLWIAILASVCTVLWVSDIDPAIPRTALHICIAAGVVGVAAWCAFFSGLKPTLRWTLAALPTAFVASYYLGLLPIQTITDGDVGIVGWRWRADAPDKKLKIPEVAIDTSLDWQPTAHDYPRFLGTGYWAEVPDVELDTDWKTNPPQELWRRKIGAGWSAFSIVGEYAVTQEQRDHNELVTCYQVRTGEIVWTHSDPVRWDPGGAGALGYTGPRATPTIHDGKVFAQGATGILNCLDARTGGLLWSHDTFAKHDASNVLWGKACSPLIVDSMVVVSVGGKQNQSVVAYDIATGDVVWASGNYRSSYASPTLTEFSGVRQIVTVDEGFVTARRADDGKPLWEYKWPSDSDASAAASQPVPLSSDRLFLSKGYGHGSILLQVDHNESDGWQLEPLWSGGLKTVLKTKMGNVLVSDGYVYGIDDVNLQCIKLETGRKLWKKRRRPKFGHGQIMLVGDAILILSEVGELILVEATPTEYRELASMRVFDETQITWNNPAFSSPYLLVRNAEEAVCYELPVKATADLVEKN